ncbi:MAG: sterol desaturase family protein [Chitinophagales bacterium]|jgi:sterol desaturase/sphingolipid hydroxylase (fatty acid hydroxylase superfamily)
MWLVALFSGIVAWTFAEYMLHRFLGHEHKGKNFFKAEHSVHHSVANYFAPTYKKLIAAIMVASFLLLVLSLFLSVLNAASFMLGFTGMYSLYEITHYRYHAAKPLIKPFIELRKHHFYHHFHNPKMNHGVTTRFWDRVFGTFHKADVVRVPKQMTMRWLVAGDEIKEKYTDHFLLGKR